jgi:two-component system chemotaxis response regulator CheB
MSTEKKSIADKSANKSGKVNMSGICIGASAGGMNALSELLPGISPEINAAFFIVVHLGRASMAEVLISRLQKQTQMVCKVAEHDEPVKKGTVYLAPADVHLLVADGKIVIGHGPEENRFRPSIDVLFRSVAVSFSEKSIGIILTGYLNDGVMGMSAIHECNGYCIVQDPNEAEYPDMPLAVLEQINVDECLPLVQIPAAILKKSREKTGAKKLLPPMIVAESEISEKMATSLANLEEIAEKSIYSCPDCGGGLWKMDHEGKPHYRCHIGHAYLEDDLLAKQGETIEKTIWVALRMMEERKNLFSKSASQYENRGLQSLTQQYRLKAMELELHINVLKELLYRPEKSQIEKKAS